MDKQHKTWFPPNCVPHLKVYEHITHSHFLGIIKPTFSFITCPIKQRLLCHILLNSVAYSKFFISIEKNTSFRNKLYVYYGNCLLQKLEHGFFNVTKCTINHGFSSILKCNWCKHFFHMGLLLSCGKPHSDQDIQISSLKKWMRQFVFTPCGCLVE